MKKLWIGACAGALGALGSAMAVAQDGAGAASPALRTHVADARPEPTVQQVERQAETITRMDDYHHEPLARFEDKICPGILGLPVDVAGIMVDRIRDDAERVGAKLDPAEKCKANILVVFVRDGAAELRKLFDTSGFLFAGLESAEIREIRKETGPARAWNVTTLRTRYGQSESPAFETGAVNMQSYGPGGPIHVATMPTGDSRILRATRQDISYSVVVIDVAATDGMPVVAIADYAAMRALARTRPAPGNAAASTILSLFDPSGQHPRELTSFDLAYLRSLYAKSGNLPAAANILGVARELRTAREEARK